MKERSAAWLRKRAKRKSRGCDHDPLWCWFSEDVDVRKDPDIGEQLIAFLTSNAARTIVVTEGIIGCPHEEGVDYHIGASSPHCPYWAGRDRFTLERNH